MPKELCVGAEHDRGWFVVRVHLKNAGAIGRKAEARYVLAAHLAQLCTILALPNRELPLAHRAHKYRQIFVHNQFSMSMVSRLTAPVFALPKIVVVASRPIHTSPGLSLTNA